MSTSLKSLLFSIVGNIHIEAPDVHLHCVLINPSVGKHNGTVQGRVYFRCPPGHGVFVKPSRLNRGPLTMDKEPQTLIR